MSKDEHLLIFADPHRFWKLVQMEDAQARFDGCKEFDDFVLCEIIRYGVYIRDEMIGPLAAFYREFVMRMPEERRFELSRHVYGILDAADYISVNAFLPFIFEDDSRQIVASTVIDFVSLGPLTENRPMSRVKEVIGMIESGRLKNEGAAFGALLHLGDRRVCQLLRPLRDTLDREALSQMNWCKTGFMHAATVDFYLDWLEGLEGDIRDRQFGAVAAGLALLRSKRKHDDVFTGERPFPTRGVPRDQLLKMLKPMKFDDYLDRIAPRMYAIERAEPPPRIMPHVLAEWGLTPRTAPSETSPLDDLVKTSAASLAPPDPLAVGVFADVDEEWWDGEGNIFLIWGILNPNGPTLYVLGSREFGGKHRVFFRWLHILAGHTTYAANLVDDLTYQGIREDAESLQKHLLDQKRAGLFDDVPSFVIANGSDLRLASIAKRLISRGAVVNANWGRHMAYVRQFGSDFFGLVGAEMREYYESSVAKLKAAGEEQPKGLEMIRLRHAHMPQFTDAKIPQWTHSSMTPELFDEWWGILSTKSYQQEALYTLKSMWEGAASLISSSPDSKLKANLPPWESVMNFLGNYRFVFPG